jgi:hypothetical protein
MVCGQGGESQVGVILTFGDFGSKEALQKGEFSMSAEANKTTHRRFYEEVVNQKR